VGQETKTKTGVVFLKAQEITMDREEGITAIIYLQAKGGIKENREHAGLCWDNMPQKKRKQIVDLYHMFS